MSSWQRGVANLQALGQFIGMVRSFGEMFASPPGRQLTAWEAGFAAADELESYRHTPGSVFLGTIHPDHGDTFEAGISDDRHLFIIAGTRAGKGVSFGIQNALRWQGGLVAIDPKGEAASITAMRRGSAEKAKRTGTQVRRFLGQKVAILDPFGEVRGPARIYRTQYNPLLDIAVGTSAQTRQIKSIAAAIIVPEQGTGAHFSESAETLLAGTIEAVMQNEARDRQTLPFVRQKLLAGFEALTDYLAQKMLPEGLAAEALGVLTDVLGTDEAGSFRTTLSRNLKWLSDPDMRAHLQPSTFSLRELVQSDGSLYIVIKPDLIDDNKGWLRLLVRLALSAKIDLGDKQQGPQTLFMLDEFAALGRVKEIEKSAGYMAGYGVKLLPIIQNVGQVKDLYDRNWETFLGNAGAIIAWGLNDDESEKYIADRCGRVLISETSTSTNSGQSGALGFGNMSSGKSASTALHERPVLYPNQVHALGARETMRAFVIPASGKPFMVQRVPYMSLDGRQLFDGPADIARWEARFGEGG